MPDVGIVEGLSVPWKKYKKTLKQNMTVASSLLASESYGIDTGSTQDSY